MATKPVALNGFRGINNREAPERIHALPSPQDPLVELVDAVNVDLDDSGRLLRRAGQTLKVAGAAHSLWSNQQLCLYVQAGSMYRLDEAFTATRIAAGLSDDPLAYVEANERIYHSNGRTTAVVDAGRVRSWGMRLSDIDVSASTTNGAMEAGVYLFAMTLLRADGQESGAGLAQRIDLPANGGITFAWSVPADLGVVGVALYVSQPSGETLYQAALVNVEAAGYTYSGGSRSLELSSQWLDAPPAGQALALYRGRIYIGAGDVLYATAPLGYEYCDLRDFLAIDGSEIRLLAPVTGGIFVGTARAVWFLQGNEFKDATLTLKLDAPAVAGSFVSADGELVTGNGQLAGQPVALFAVAGAVVMGLPDGTLMNLTQERYEASFPERAAATFRTDGITQYLLASTA